MKKPLIDKCPCCEVSFTDEDRHNPDYCLPKAECENIEFVNADHIGHILHWACQHCGAKWKHGQFEPECEKAITFKGEQVTIASIKQVTEKQAVVTFSNGKDMVFHNWRRPPTEEEVVMFIKEKGWQFGEKEV